MKHCDPPEGQTILASHEISFGHHATVQHSFDIPVNVPSIGKEHVVVWVDLDGVRVMLDGTIVILGRKGLVAESDGRSE